MSWLLQFPASTAYIVTGRLVLGGGHSVSFEIQRDSDVNIYLSSDSGDEFRYIVGTGWQIRLSSTYFTYPEASLTPPIGERFTVTLSRVGATTERSVQLNGGAIVTKTTSGVNFWFNNIGQGVGGVYQAFKLYKCTITNPSAPTTNRVFDADASGGTGTILPNTLTGTNNGTQAGAGWPSDNSEWVFYSSGGTAYADLLNGATFTSSIGTLASSAAHTDVLNGVSYTSSVNSLNTTRGYGDTLSGLTYSASVGQLDARRGYSSLLVGGTYSYTVSNLESTNTSATGRDDALQGINLSFAVGSLVSTVQRNTTLAGLSYTSAVGNLSASLAYNSALLGLTYSASVNTLLHTWSGEVTVTIEGYTIKYADSIVAAAYANDIISAGYAADILERITWQH